MAGKDSSQNQMELRKIRRLLQETIRLAEKASMTGSLEGGGRMAIRQYNRIRDYLEEHDFIPDDLFQGLDEDNTTFDELGVVTSMLEGYLADEGEPLPPEPPPPPGRPNFSLNIGYQKELEELRDLGQLIRENMPEWLRARQEAALAAREAERGGENLAEQEGRLAEVGAQFQAAADRMGHGDLSEQQRAELIDQLAQLGQEQSRLSRRIARMRERHGG
jgi:hypothetical protein